MGEARSLKTYHLRSTNNTTDAMKMTTNTGKAKAILYSDPERIKHYFSTRALRAGASYARMATFYMGGSWTNKSVQITYSRHRLWAMSRSFQKYYHYV